MELIELKNKIVSYSIVISTFSAFNEVTASVLAEWYL